MFASITDDDCRPPWVCLVPVFPTIQQVGEHLTRLAVSWQRLYLYHGHRGLEYLLARIAAIRVVLPYTR